LIRSNSARSASAVISPPDENVHPSLVLLIARLLAGWRRRRPERVEALCGLKPPLLIVAVECGFERCLRLRA
jgi:hypothetical protein